MRYKILYILFFIAALLYGNYRIFWGITPRNVMTIVMMVVCIIEDRRFFLDKWFGIYLFFLLFFAMSSMLTGYLSQFLHRLIGFFLVGYVGYWSTKILVKKYEAVRLVLSLFLIIGLLDIVVTIGQFYNVPFFTVIPQLMGISVDAEFLDDLNTGEEALGVVLPGIMATDVYNGYFLMVIGVLSFCFLRSGFRIIALLPWLLTMVASFMVQQRAPFYILIFVSAFVIIKVVLLGKSRFKWLFVLLLLVLIPIGVEHLYDFLISGDSRAFM